MKLIDTAISDYLAYRKQDNNESLLLANMALIESYRYVETDRDYLLNSLQTLLDDLLKNMTPKKQSFVPLADATSNAMIQSLCVFQYEHFEDVVLQATRGKHLRAKLFLSLQDSLQTKQDYHMAALIELWHYTSLVFDDIIDDSSMRREHVTLNESLGRAKAVDIANCLLLHVLIGFAKIELFIHEYVYRTFVSMHQAELYQLKNNYRVVAQYQVFDYYVTGKTVSLIELSMTLALVVTDNLQMLENICELSMSFGSAFQYRDDILDIIGTPDKDANQDIKNGILNFVYISLIQCKSEYLLMSFEEVSKVAIDDQHLSSCIEHVNQSFKSSRDMVKNMMGEECVFSQQIIKLTDRMYI